MKEKWALEGRFELNPFRVRWLIRRSRASLFFPNFLTFHFQTTFIFAPQSSSAILKTAVSRVVMTGKQ